MKISKLDVATRELEYSLRLFFLSGDPVIIHLVSSSAQSILRDLARKRGVPTTLDNIIQKIKQDKKKIVIDKLSEAHNFMKHADRDSDVLIEFNPDLSEFVFWESINIYDQLTHETTGIMQSYRVYFYIKHVDLMEEQKDKELVKKLTYGMDLSNKNAFLDFATQLENNRTK